MTYRGQPPTGQTTIWDGTKEVPAAIGSPADTPIFYWNKTNTSQFAAFKTGLITSGTATMAINTTVTGSSQVLTISGSALAGAALYSADVTFTKRFLMKFGVYIPNASAANRVYPVIGFGTANTIISFPVDPNANVPVHQYNAATYAGKNDGSNISGNVWSSSTLVVVHHELEVSLRNTVLGNAELIEGNISHRVGGVSSNGPFTHRDILKSDFAGGWFTPTAITAARWQNSTINKFVIGIRAESSAGTAPGFSYIEVWPRPSIN